MSVAQALALLLAAAIWPGAAAAGTPPFPVLTHHYDIGRTGWNAQESVLTPANVGAPGAFGLLNTIPLDGRLDAQPLVVPGIAVSGDPNAGTHDVVYAATDNNTVYAIDPVAGKVLLQHNLGPPANKLVGCDQTITGIGIQGTPVIDLARGALYAVSATMNGAAPVFMLHKLSLTTLADMVPAVTVSGGQTLTNGLPVQFAPSQLRQRPALLEMNNGASDTIYAGFGSYCDNAQARGWVLGWNADTLAPLLRSSTGMPIGMTTNRDAAAPHNMFLSSIWMAGSGLAGDGSAIYFVTGNSDYSGTTYDGVNNTPHSAIKLSPATLSRLDLFTPEEVANLDKSDLDFGSGGIMLLPPLGGSVPPLATAAGKTGKMYLLNRNNMGGFTPGGPDRVLSTVQAGWCQCAQSYFAAPVPTVVSSGRNQVILWHIATSPAVKFQQYAASVPNLPSGSGGTWSFFTSVSSNGASAASAVIWAVLRPVNPAVPVVTLAAFAAVPTPGTKVLPQIFAGAAGTWPGAHTAAFLVPVVANGRVYVGSNGALSIFGLLPAGN